MKASPPLVLSLLIPVVLVLGFLAPFEMPALIVVLGIGLATFITVAGLSQGWQGRINNYTAAGRLFVVNVVAGSIPLVLVAMVLGLSNPLGLGFMILALMPVAAGLPAYAATLGMRAERITLFTLASYAIALVVTPFAVSALLGDNASRPAITTTILLGLILPTILGVVVAKPVARISSSVRRAVTVGSLLVAIFGVGSQIGLDVSLAAVTNVSVVLVVVAALLRAPLTAALGAVLNSVPQLSTNVREAALAGGYKNCALAAVIALAAGIPEAAIPGALGLASEALLLLSLTALSKHQDRSSRREGS